MKLGESIKNIRTEHHLSQEEFGEKYHVTRQTVSNWENGKSIPDLELLVAISEDFNISMDRMLKEDKDLVKENDAQRHFGKKALLVSVFIAVVSIVCIAFFYSSYRKAIRLDYKIADQQSVNVKVSDAPLKVREGYFQVMKDETVHLFFAGDSDDGNIRVCLKNQKGDKIYEHKASEINDKEEIHLNKGEYYVQITVKDFGEGLLTYGYDFQIHN
ncbi:MAG: helix-turn-helix domain-containing protein [Lachnospiraceae bacterium]|nr:helix-turn-helix domain-containing protein [Lachnospiraceae bacterium]